MHMFIHAYIGMCSSVSTGAVCTYLLRVHVCMCEGLYMGASMNVCAHMYGHRGGFACAHLAMHMFAYAVLCDQASCICTRTELHMHVCMTTHAHIHMCLRVCAEVALHVHLCAFLLAYMCICAASCERVHVYTLI